MRRIAVLLMTMSALLTVCVGCAWKGNFEWCEGANANGHRRTEGQMHRQADRRVAELPACTNGSAARHEP